jgi:hypothetical protein
MTLKEPIRQAKQLYSSFYNESGTMILFRKVKNKYKLKIGNSKVFHEINNPDKLVFSIYGNNVYFVSSKTGLEVFMYKSGELFGHHTVDDVLAASIIHTRWAYLTKNLSVVVNKGEFPKIDSVEKIDIPKDVYPIDITISSKKVAVLTAAGEVLIYEGENELKRYNDKKYISIRFHHLGKLYLITEKQDLFIFP